MSNVNHVWIYLVMFMYLGFRSSPDSNSTRPYAKTARLSGSGVDAQKKEGRSI